MTGDDPLANIPLDLAAAIFVLVFLYWLIPARGRKPLMLLSSLAMLTAYSPSYSLLVISQVALTFAAVTFLLRGQGASRAFVFRAILAWLVGCLVVIKVKIGTDWQTPTLAALGSSYITFRLIHYAVLANRRELKQAKFFDLLNHTVFFPSLLAGPVSNYESYAAQHPETARMGFKLINLALLRILMGIFKKFVLADQLYFRFISPVLAHSSVHSRWCLASTVCADLLHIYLDFSGYTDIAIGTASLFGYRLPENFNHPLLKPNIAEFWRSWHITIHDFIRDHFFVPLFGYRPSRAKIYAGLICTMLLMMLWHAFTWGFLVLGLLHGLALALWYRLQEMKRRDQRLAWLFGTRPAWACGVLLTFLFCSFSAEFGFRGYPATIAFYSMLLGK